MSKDEDLWHMEEDFYSKDSKASRKERKRVSIKDRSKFKKSDQDQLKKKTSLADSDGTEHLLRGRVLAILPEGTLVSCGDKEYLCSLKGSLKQDKSRMKNLLAVGDFVRIEESGGDQGCIAKVEERHSILSRADNLSRNKEQLIAVNIDQVLITASVIFPPLKPFLIDRYIIASQKGNMEPIILINKIDYLSTPPDEIDAASVENEKALYDEFLRIYRDLHFKVIPISVETGVGIEELKSAMHGKTSVFSGQSGVGKSSLINLVTGSSLATGSVVQRTRKGSHTTTTTHLVPLEEGGFCIDTPGIKSFGLWDLEPDEVASYFPEIFALSSECKYPDCSHISEPDCAVKKAVEENRISSLRFASYCALMSSVSEEHRQR
ncbi:MAG: ribosome small subunit-dependent GTPase A [Verrucomicrobia bacterium]|nr:ribosome small subunit-dependent GTPase A [Verrucomicrobiota bacterium]